MCFLPLIHLLMLNDMIHHQLLVRLRCFQVTRILQLFMLELGICCFSSFLFFLLLCGVVVGDRSGRLWSASIFGWLVVISLRSFMTTRLPMMRTHWRLVVSWILMLVVLWVLVDSLWDKRWHLGSRELLWSICIVRNRCEFKFYPVILVWDMNASLVLDWTIEVLHRTLIIGVELLWRNKFEFFSSNPSSWAPKGGLVIDIGVVRVWWLASWARLTDSVLLNLGRWPQRHAIPRFVEHHTAVGSCLNLTLWALLIHGVLGLELVLAVICDSSASSVLYLFILVVSVIWTHIGHWYWQVVCIWRFLSTCWALPGFGSIAKGCLQMDCALIWTDFWICVLLHLHLNSNL